MDRKLGVYFIKYNSAGGLTHAGTGKTVMTTFDNGNIRKSIRVNLESLICDVDNQKLKKKDEDIQCQSKSAIFVRKNLRGFTLRDKENTV